MLHMIFQGLAINQNIIHKYENTLSEQRLEYRVHKGLEGSRCVSKTKRHYSEFLVTMMCFRSYFVLIF